MKTDSSLKEYRLRHLKTLNPLGPVDPIRINDPTLDSVLDDSVRNAKDELSQQKVLITASGDLKMQANQLQNCRTAEGREVFFDGLDKISS